MKNILITIITLMSISTSAIARNFLFITFKGEQSPMTEQVYFALSKDGLAWEQTNDGKPVLVSKLGEKGVRDPFLLRSHDGKKFFLIATDLSINLNHNWGRAVTAGSKSIMIWESEDLVKWTEPRLVQVAPDDAGCTWAPEAVYDNETQSYLVFWASTTGRDQFKKHRIWATRTKDFATFDKPFIYIEKEHTTIDTDIVFDGKKYYRFTKDEKGKAVTMESADKLSGPWTDKPQFSLGKMTGVEGPQCFLLNPAENDKPATWCLVLDHYARGAGYHAYVTTDLATGKFEALPDMKFPYKFRHGSILDITPDEFERVKTAFPNK